MINYYKILGVKNFAPVEEVKSAYRKLSKRLHPDVNDNDPFFTEKFKELQEAFECLNHSAKRARYDSQLHNYLNNLNTSPPHNNTSSQNTRREEPKKEAPKASTAPLEKKRPVGSVLISLGIAVVMCFRIVSCLSSKSDTVAQSASSIEDSTSVAPAMPDTTSSMTDTSSAVAPAMPDTTTSIVNQHNGREESSSQEQDDEPDYFTINSSKSEVIRIQGNPISTEDYSLYEQWTYANESTVNFVNDKVKDFNNSGGTLKVKF